VNAWIIHLYGIAGISLEQSAKEILAHVKWRREITYTANRAAGRGRCEAHSDQGANVASAVTSFTQFVSLRTAAFGSHFPAQFRRRFLSQLQYETPSNHSSPANLKEQEY
jgi:hypothetical protein